MINREHLFSLSGGCCRLHTSPVSLPPPPGHQTHHQWPLTPAASLWKPSGEKWGASRKKWTGRKKMKQRGRAWMVNWQQIDVLFLSLSSSHLSLFYRSGAGGGMAYRGGAVLLSNRGGHTPGSRGVAVYADTATSCHSEEEAGQLQWDAEEQKQTANQRCAGYLHWDNPAHLDTKTGCLLYHIFMSKLFIKSESK